MKKRNLASKIMTTGLAAAMVFSMSMPVWAVTGDSAKMIENVDNVKINKTLEMPASGVTKPTETFTFTVAKDTTADNASDAPAVPDGNTYSIATSALTANKSAAIQTAVFDGIDFSSTKPGVYWYTIKETIPSDATNNAKAVNNGTLTYDDTTYYAKVRVSSSQDDDGNSTSAVTGVVVTTDKSATTDSGKADSISFKNTYTKYGNSDNGGDTDQGVVISKKATGSKVDSNDTFTFSVTFTKATGNDSLGDTPISMTTSGKTVTGTGTVNTSAMGYGTYSFTLGTNDSIAFKVPAGTTYSVTETKPADKYSSTTYSTQSGSSKNSGSGLAASDLTVNEGVNTVAFVNDTGDDSPLTGIVNNYGGLIAVVAIAAGGMVVLTLRRRRDA